MPRRLIYSALGLGSSAMLMYLLGFISRKTGFNQTGTYLYAFAGKLLLTAFALLILFAVATVIMACYRDLSHYWRREAIALRRLLSIHYQTIHTRQRNQHLSRQLYYQHRFKQQKLTAADNRKQLHALYRSVKLELQTAKPQFADTEYQHLQKTLRQYLKQADASGILALHQKLTCR